MPRPVDIDEWRRRAAEAREQATRVRRPEVAATLRDIADTYDRLIADAERTQGAPPGVDGVASTSTPAGLDSTDR